MVVNILAICGFEGFQSSFFPENSTAWADLFEALVKIKHVPMAFMIILGGSSKLVSGDPTPPIYCSQFI